MLAAGPFALGSPLLIALAVFIVALVVLLTIGMLIESNAARQKARAIPTEPAPESLTARKPSPPAVPESASSVRSATPPAPIPAKRTSPASHPQNKTHRPGKRLVACPDCSREVQLGKLHQHRKTAHGTIRRCPACRHFIRADRIAHHNLKQHKVCSDELLDPRVLPCPRCHNTVLARRLPGHLYRVHQYNFHVARGRHPYLAALWRPEEPFWLVDGRGLLELQGRDGPLGVECLLAITYRVLQDKQDFLCIFDAASGVMFDRSRQPAMADLYRRLLRRYPDRLGEVADRESAEQIMLDIARTFQPRIVCNRLFNTHVLQHPAKLPTFVDAETRQMPNHSDARRRV